MTEAVPRNLESNDWITIILIIAVLLVVFTKMTYPFSFRRFGKRAFLHPVLIEDRGRIKEMAPLNTILFFAHILILSMGLFFCFSGFGFVSDIPVILFLKIFVIFSVFVAAKYLIEKMTGVILAVEELSNLYIRYKITYKNYLSLGLLPVLVVLAYVWPGDSFFFKTALFIFFLLNLYFLLYFYQKTQILKKHNLYYIFLYLCTFEIAPYFILYKVIV